MSKTEESKQKTKDIKEARYRLWYLGELSWKLDATQLKIYNFFHECPEKVIVINCSRRLGKSYLLAIMAIEQCLKKPKSIVKMLQPEQKMVRMNIRPIMDKILRDCPDDLRPEYKTQDSIYMFKNGSELQLAGTDNGNHEKLRGGDSHLNIVDEAGFCSDLRYVINSILIPTTTLTRGKIILSSTTPPNPGHEFVKSMQDAEVKGNLIRKTIHDAVEDSKSDENPRITAEVVADIVKSLPDGEKSQEFRTEYLCEVIHYSDLSVIPEFSEVKEDIVVQWPRPIFYDRYTSMDIGFKDLTAVLFAYYDFDHGVVVIEDEFSVNGIKMTTDYLAQEIRKKEESLWTDKMTGEFQQPYKRISDNNPIVINDLLRLHNLIFHATQKDNKDAQVNNTRMMIGGREVMIHPRCKQLISHLENGIWKTNRKEFDRSADNGHFDFIDALIYLLRNIDRNRNPYPKNYRHSLLGRSGDLFHNPHFKPLNEAKGFGRLTEQFKVKSSFKKK